MASSTWVTSVTSEIQRNYMVIMDGHILEGADRAVVVKKLARLFGKTAEEVEALLQGEQLIIKKNLPPRVAHKYFRTITNAGGACHLEEDQAFASSASLADQEPDKAASNLLDNLSVTATDAPEMDKDIRRRVKGHMKGLIQTGEFQINDFELRQTSDNIVFLAMISLICGLLAVIYIII